MTKPIDLTGHTYGRWTVIARADNNPRGYARWHCICTCGTEKVVLASNLRNGISSSCGCLRLELVLAKNPAARGHPPPFWSWYGMVQRCTNPKTKDFNRYGGRGIGVCQRWLSFENFLADMGTRPSDDHSLERIDNSKGYAPDNCKWALPKEQNRNRRDNVRITWNGETKVISDWADELGISRASMYWRYQNGHRGDRLFRIQGH